MNEFEKIIKDMTNKTKGLSLICTSVIICIGGFLLTDHWFSNADLAFNIKNSYITIFQYQDNSGSGLTSLSGKKSFRIPFSVVFFISSVSFLIGCIFLSIGDNRKK